MQVTFSFRIFSCDYIHSLMMQVHSLDRTVFARWRYSKYHFLVCLPIPSIPVFAQLKFKTIPLFIFLFFLSRHLRIHFLQTSRCFFHVTVNVPLFSLSLFLVRCTFSYASLSFSLSLFSAVFPPPVSPTLPFTSRLWILLSNTYIARAAIRSWPRGCVRATRLCET